MNDVDRIAQAIMDATGAKPGDTIRILTPQFDREPGATPPALDVPISELHRLSPAELGALGCRRWDDASNPTVPGHLLYLFPAEWYPKIPRGFEIVTIYGDRKLFSPGETSDDRRFGVLAYGVLRPIAE